jgi:hypothetical protein
VLRTFSFMRALVGAVAALSLWLACTTQVDATQFAQLPDCLNPAACPPSPAVSAPVATEVPPGDAGPGIDAGLFDVFIPQTSLPETGPGPGISGVTGTGLPPGSSGELGPVCPALQPTNGAPCDPIANSLPCAFSLITCTCVQTWVCF